MTTALIRFTQRARENPQRHYTALMGLLFNPEGLHASFERQAANKASGVDGMRKRDYAERLDARIADLSARLQRLGYQPQPSRRVYIPKGNGGRRALGVPCFEDRIVQDRLSLILQAIWEPEFRDCSYGSRPERNAHQALKRLAEIITIERTQWVVEADIKGFFDHLSHHHLERFLAHRIADPRLLRIIKRFLKAGVWEDGIVSTSEYGTPQGGRAMMQYVYRHVQGHLQYYAVSGNTNSVRSYVYQVTLKLFKWLNRRSQRRSTTWARFGKAIKRYLPRMRIIHDLYPSRL